MGSCTRRHFLLSTCFLQMITIIERQVFDFLGFMWAPICVNFFHIILVIFGFYGAYHLRIKCIITYLVWNVLWIGWNAFLICFYLNVGELDRDSDVLNLGTGSVSWFEVNGYGCKPTYPINITSDDPFRPLRPEKVDDCFLNYEIVEVVQAGVQCFLAFLGIIGAILISCIFLDEDDRFDFMNGDAKSPQHTVVHPMYVSYTSIPTSTSATMQSNKISSNNHSLSHQHQHQHHPHYNNNHHSNHNMQNSNPNLLPEQMQQQQHQHQHQHQQKQNQPQPQTLQLQLQQQQQQQYPYNNHYNSKNNINININNSSIRKSQEQATNQKNNAYLSYTNNPNHSNTNFNCNFINNNNNSNGSTATGSCSSGINRVKSQYQHPMLSQLKRSNSNISNTTTNYNPIQNYNSFGKKNSNFQRSYSHNPHSNYYYYNHTNNNNNNSNNNSNSNLSMTSKSNTLTRIFYNQQNNNPNNTNNQKSRATASTSCVSSITPTPIQTPTPTPTPTINELNENSLILTNSNTNSQTNSYHYYDDSTAKADQLYTNSNRRQYMTSSPINFIDNNIFNHNHNNNNNNNNINNNNNNSQQETVQTPLSQDNTSSLSYASLQNSNLYLNRQGNGLESGTGTLNGLENLSGTGTWTAKGSSFDSHSRLGLAGILSFQGSNSKGPGSSLSNSNYSLSSINNNTPNANNSSLNNRNAQNSGHFARIHSKPKPPKSNSYNSFITPQAISSNSHNNNNSLTRPDIKYTQMSSDKRLSGNFDESLEDDNFSLKNFKNDDGITYVPFQKPTPGSNIFINKNNNPSYTSLNSFVSLPNTNNNESSPLNSVAKASDEAPAPFGILLEHGAILQPAYNPIKPLPTPLSGSPIPSASSAPKIQPNGSSLSGGLILNQTDRFLHQQNGLTYHQPNYSPILFRSNHPTRPTNIPLPIVPTHSFNHQSPLSPSGEVSSPPSIEMPPPPPPPQSAPRPHIFQPRSGHAPYPDLSPEVTEKYAMPTQYIPRSPVATRIARRQRQQREKELHLKQMKEQQQQLQQQQKQQFLNSSSKTGADNSYGLLRSKSQERLSSSLRESKNNRDSNAAPHVNRRSGRRDGKARPRSYCNSMIGGEGVVRSNISADKEISLGLPNSLGPGSVGLPLDMPLNEKRRSSYLD